MRSDPAHGPAERPAALWEKTKISLASRLFFRQNRCNDSVKWCGGGGLRGLAQNYTRREVTRILGVTDRQLNYWERLHFVRPQARWGERFYNFRDLITLRTVQQLAQQRVPMMRLRRAISALEKQIGSPPLKLSALRAFPRGRDVVLVPPAPYDRPIAPLTGQFVLPFDQPVRVNKIRAIASRTAQEWFELALALESDPESLARAGEAYRQAALLAPDWADAWLHLGAVCYQLDEMEEAIRSFRHALQLERENPRAHLNLGSVLCELGSMDEALAHLRASIELDPSCPDGHLNLALAYEKQANTRAARRQWGVYLRLEPEGPWADYARTRLGRPRALRGRPAKTIPFRKSE
jgi:tetratricopeptide (TPR) repeat protein